MFKRHCLFQPLRDVIVGRSYDPQFYDFIDDPEVRSRWQQIAAETEEDYQQLIKLLESFGVNVIRPKADEHADFKTRKTSNAWFKQFGFQQGETDYPTYDCVLPPPMEPRDWFMMMDDHFIHWLHLEQMTQYQHILDHVAAQGNRISHTGTLINAEGWITKIGRRITYSLGGANWFPRPKHDFARFAAEFAPDHDNRFYDIQGFADGVYRPLKPGVILSLYESNRYAADFPNWSVIPVLGDSWSKMHKWLEFKRMRSYAEWNHGAEGDRVRRELAYEWLDGGWREYCSANVFDVNALSIDDSNVIVFNHNKTVFKELERHGITPHISHFRHRYFWGGGIHCVTSDINRDGVLEDYFN